MKRRLGHGAATFEQLLEVLPAEPGQTDDDRIKALSTLITRMRLKKQIESVNGKWVLAA